MSACLTASDYISELNSSNFSISVVNPYVIYTVKKNNKNHSIATRKKSSNLLLSPRGSSLVPLAGIAEKSEKKFKKQLEIIVKNSDNFACLCLQYQPTYIA